MPGSMRVNSPLFDGLDAAALEDVYGQMKPRQFGAREVICREGDVGDSLLVIERGLAEVTVGEAGQPRTVARLRRGEVLGELSLVNGEPRSATVIATVPTDARELGRDAFAAMLARYPVMLANLNSILGRRLAERNTRSAGRGEAVAVVARPSIGLLPDLISATRAASVCGVATLGLGDDPLGTDVRLEDPAVENVLTALDALLEDHGLVLIHVEPGQPDLLLLVEQMDRVLLLAKSDEVGRLGAELGSVADRAEVAPLGPRRRADGSDLGGLSVVRTVSDSEPWPDVAWLGRHLSRTKLGLALGAGGAKGYAHVATLYILEEAGYTIDYVSGSSIGAMVGAWLGLGMTAAEVEDTMRRAFTRENVAAMFKMSTGGQSTGLDVHTRVCRETTEDRRFSDLLIPLVVMTADLNTRQPAPITEGFLWQAMLASTALPGVFPPHQRGKQRLVDGVALIPVPSDAVRQAGADVVVSVNLLGPGPLPAWPGQMAPEPKQTRKRPSTLDVLLQVIEMSQLEASVRHAARADVTVTPRFGPGSWRDFDLADLYAEAGREAAQTELPTLQKLARPRLGSCTTPG